MTSDKALTRVWVVAAVTTFASAACMDFGLPGLGRALLVPGCISVALLAWLSLR